jgi:hypothetical protein
MMSETSFEAFLNPLQLLEGDEPWSSALKRPLTYKAFVEFLCTPGLQADLASLVERYQEISREQRRLFAAPTEERILEKLIWPLRHAKAGYVVGNYLGTISLC